MTAAAARATFRLSVQSPWFELLRSGDKRYEGRLNVSPYSTIQPGDRLLISHSSDPSLPSFPLQVTAVHSFPTFHCALTALPLSSVLPGIADVPAGVAVYERFYSTERQTQRGVRMLRVTADSSPPDTAAEQAQPRIVVEGPPHGPSPPSLSPAPSPSPIPLPSSSASLPPTSPCSPPLLDLTFLHSSPLRHSESPGRSHQLDIGQETSQLQRALTSSSRQFRVAFDVCTADRLLSALSCTTALHISGHGDPQHLVMEDGRGDVQGLSVALLQRVLGMSGVRRLQFVLVSACYSFRAGLAFAVAGVPHVIAVQEDTQVSDASARAFAEHVYLALCQGLTVEEAFKRGQAAVINSSSPPCCCAHLHTPPTCSLCPHCRTPICCPVHAAPCHSSSRLSSPSSTLYTCCQPSLAHDESLKFALLPSTTSHAVPIFPCTSPPSSGRWIDRSPLPPPNNLPLPPERFLGRAGDVLALVRDTLKLRVVGLWGVEGVGKTAVGVAAGRYVRDRKHFEEVWVAKLEGVSEVRDIDRALARVLGIPQRQRSEGEADAEEEAGLHDRVLGHLQQLHSRKPVLLILDDVDGLIEGGSVQPASLTRAISDVPPSAAGTGREQGREGWPEPLVLRARGKEEKDDEKKTIRLEPAQRELAGGGERGRDRARSTEKNNSNRALSSPPARPSPPPPLSSGVEPVGKEEKAKSAPKRKKSGKGYHSILPHDAPRPPPASTPTATTTSSSSSPSSSSKSSFSPSSPAVTRAVPAQQSVTAGADAWEDDWELVDHDDADLISDTPLRTCTSPPRTLSKVGLLRSRSSAPISPVSHSRTSSTGSFSLQSLLPSSFSSTTLSALPRAATSAASHPHLSHSSSFLKRLVGRKERATPPALPTFPTDPVVGKRAGEEQKGEGERETAGETRETYEGGEGRTEGSNIEGLTAHDEEVVNAAERMGFHRSRCVQAVHAVRAQRVVDVGRRQEVQMQGGAGHSPSSAVLVQHEGMESSPSPSPPSPEAEGEWGMEGLPRVDVEVSLQSLLTWLLDHEGEMEGGEGEERERRAPLVHLSIDSLEQGAQQQLLLSPCIYLSPLIDEPPPSTSPAPPPSPPLPVDSLLPSPSSSSSSLHLWLDAHGFTDLLPTLHSASILSLSHLLTLDDSALHSAGVKPMGRRKDLLQTLRREASHRRRSSALTGRAAFTAYVVSLLDHTSCHLLLTSRTRPPHFTPYPSRHHRLVPLHPLDTALLFIHRLSHALSSADLVPYRASSLQELAQHPLIVLMEGNARVVERVAEAERLMGMRKVWELMMEDEVEEAGESEDQGAVSEAARMVSDARRLARLTREAEAERRRAASLGLQLTRSAPPTSLLTPSPMLTASPLPLSPSLSPMLPPLSEAAVEAVPPSAHPASVLSLFDAMKGQARGAEAAASRAGVRSPAFPSSATSLSLYPAAVQASWLVCQYIL